MFAPGSSPTPDVPEVTTSSARVQALGSAWQLDCKRYASADEGGGDAVAVYLHRRPPRAAPADALPEDTRTATTLGFSIRLAGAPGAPTSNSVCGRSVAGKAFGRVDNASWGWGSFLSAATLTEPATWADTSLRFCVTLDML